MAAPIYPDCVNTCMPPAFAAAGCPMLDSSCPCTTGADAFNKNLTPCVTKSCSKSDVTKFQSLWSGYCTSIQKNEAPPSTSINAASSASAQTTTPAPLVPLVTTSAAPDPQLPVQKPVQASSTALVQVPTTAANTKTTTSLAVASPKPSPTAPALLPFQSSKPFVATFSHASSIAQLSYLITTPSLRTDYSLQLSNTPAPSDFTPKVSVLTSNRTGTALHSKPSLSTAIAAGIGVSVAIAVLFLFTLLFIFISRHRHRNQVHEEKHHFSIIPSSHGGEIFHREDSGAYGRMFEMGKASPGIRTQPSIVIPPRHPEHNFQRENSAAYIRRPLPFPPIRRDFQSEGIYELEAIEMKCDSVSPTESESQLPQYRELHEGKNGKTAESTNREEDLGVRTVGRGFVFPRWVEVVPERSEIGGRPTIPETDNIWC